MASYTSEGAAGGGGNPKYTSLIDDTVPVEPVPPRNNYSDSHPQDRYPNTSYPADTTPYTDKSLPPTPAGDALVPPKKGHRHTDSGYAGDYMAPYEQDTHSRDGDGDRYMQDNHPTESHALAASSLPSAPSATTTEQDTHPKGAVQQINPNDPPTDRTINVPGSSPSDTAITDLGWHEAPSTIPAPLVGGISNDDLWTLIRRFDKQLQHVRRLPPGTKLPGDLDLSVSQDEAFSPDRLRGNVERLYMTVIVGLAALVKHLARLRSWEDSRRTMLFALAYFGAWGVDLLGPLVWGTLLCLIVLPRSRGFLFPPAAALANVDAKTGAVKPVAAHGHGLAMSGDSLTGAREAQKGEAVEQEAHNFVSAFGGIAISSAAGKQHTSAEGGTDGDGEGKKKAAPDPTSAAIKAIDAKDSAEGGATGTKAATKKPVEEAMWEKARPVMQGVGVVADIWEQIGNMLSPTPPFSRKLRWRLGGIAGGLGLVSLIVTPYMVMKGLSFAIGFGFFGDPVIQRGLTYLNTNYPNWKESLDLRNTLLKTVPTNAQLTLTLLRIGEAHHAPLPPPPQTATTAAPPPTPPAEETPGTIEHDKKEKEQQVTDEKPSKSKLPARALAALKNTTKTAVKTTLHTDHLKAKVVGSEAAKNRLGAVPDKKPSADEQGPKTFAARYQGEKGTAVILEPQNAHILEGDPKGVEAIRAAGPVLKWTRDKGGKHGEEEGFVIPIEDIVEVEKLGGLGWKGKVIVGWSLDRQVVDAVRLVYKVGDAGLTDEKVLTAVVGREEVVNRLIAMGSQRWVCC